MLPSTTSLKRMRVQLQQGAELTHSVSVSAIADDGVTIRQVCDAMQDLYRSTPDKATWYPMARVGPRKKFGHAISQMSRDIKKYIGHGIDTEGNIERIEWEDRGTEYRLDLENFGGSNLRNRS